MKGGYDRRELQPLNPDGNWREGWYGSHRGAAEGLNVRGVAPGFIPYWVRHPRRDRGGSQLQRFLNEGWEVAPPECQIQTPATSDPNYAALGLDGFKAHGDVILIQIREDKYREFCRRRAQHRDAAVDGPTREFLRRGEPYQHRYGDTADGPIYYTGPGHGRFSE